MKILVSPFAVLITLLFSLNSYASKKITLDTHESSNELVITLEGIEQGEKFTLIDMEGKVIFEEVLEQSKIFSKSFSFKKFKQGLYQVKTVTNTSIEFTPFIIVPSMKKIMKGEPKVINRPEIYVTDENRLAIEVENNQNYEIDIYIYKEGTSNNLTKDKDLKDSVVQKFYSLPRYNTYNTVITIEGQVFEKTITIN